MYVVIMGPDGAGAYNDYLQTLSYTIQQFNEFNEINASLLLSHFHYNIKPPLVPHL
jgi:hypothetical protein